MRNAQLITGVQPMLVFFPHRCCCPLVHFFLHSVNWPEHFCVPGIRLGPREFDAGPVDEGLTS